MQITNCGRGVHKREIPGIQSLKSLPPKWYAFTNLEIATGVGRGREIDVVIVAEDRIFLIDLKDWHGKIESDNGHWVQNGRDMGTSPVGKILQNARDVGLLLKEDVKRRMKDYQSPMVFGLVIMTGSVDLTGVAATEINSVLRVEDFKRATISQKERTGRFGAASTNFLTTPLTDGIWKGLITSFFNAKSGPIRPGRRRYGSFVASSDHATFEHPSKIYSEFEAADENAANSLGTLRVWDFTKADTRFQNEEGRAEITGRERAVVEFLRDRSETCESGLLVPRLEDPERGVSYWEVYDRRRRLRRLSEFVAGDASRLVAEEKIDLGRQLLAKLAALHSIDTAHLDIGPHSIWLEAPSHVRLSHLMAASYPDGRSLGQSRFQFLSCEQVPEDILGEPGDPKRKDVFLVGAAIHYLLFGRAPASTGPDMPPEWAPSVDADGAFSALHEFFERSLAFDPRERFSDAQAALEAFNEATASHPTPKEVIEGLDRFRNPIKSQKQFITTYPEAVSVRESDRVDIWTSKKDGRDVFVKMWKRATWGDQVREGPRILDFLNRARDLALSPVPNCAPVIDVHWLGDALGLVQEFVPGTVLSDLIAFPSEQQSTDWALKLIRRLCENVSSLHERGLGHGDLKPDNIILSDDPEIRPVFVDLLDFACSDEGERLTTKYSPPVGGRQERDRFAVTKIAEDLLGPWLSEPEGLAVARAIQTCRAEVPENGTLLPLVEALDTSLAPPVAAVRSCLTLSVKGAEVGPVLGDEGRFYLRKTPDLRDFVLRGACEEIAVSLDNSNRPMRVRRIGADQKKIKRLQRYELCEFNLDIIVESGLVNEFSGLVDLMSQPEFIAAWERSDAPPSVDDAADEATDLSEQQPTFEDAADDTLTEIACAEPEIATVDVTKLWRRLIDVEGELTTDGIAQGDSLYSRDLRRHIVPFELARGTFDFNRNDTVGVEKLDKKGQWRRVGSLDLKSRPDRVLINASEMSNPAQSGLVVEGQRLKFTSHFGTQSLKRRESAISRILSNQARITNLAQIFDCTSVRTPALAPLIVDDDALGAYGLNDTQREAFKKLVATRPIGLVQGPPGTGKTLFIAALSHYALTKGLAKNILLASQSHEAVNNAAEAVLKLFGKSGERPSILRVGMEGVVSDPLLPFHTDRVEQLYKDRFSAEFLERVRLVSGGQGVPESLVDELFFIEMTVRPVLQTLAAMEIDVSADAARISSLRVTLGQKLAYLGLSETLVDEGPFDPQACLEDIVSAAVARLPRGDRPAPDLVARTRALIDVGKDFVASVSTSQRSFEAFLAGTRQIVAGTCVGLGRPSLGLTTTPFDLVIVDEAARCTASELAVPMQAGRWVVLVGDHIQLEPQHASEVVVQVAQDIGTSHKEVMRSDFERVFKSHYGLASGHSLGIQYRMLPAIGRVVSNTFYRGNLNPGRFEPEVPTDALPPDLDRPITWITTDALGERGGERREFGGSSRTNEAEATTIATLLKQWSKFKPLVGWAAAQNKHVHVIGVICMYAAQRDLVKKRVQSMNLPDKFRRLIKIDTVDSYQGKENPIVIVSLVRNNTEGATEAGLSTIREGFLSRPNRVNVAVSRAMDRLVIVGSKARWRKGGPMCALADAVEEEYRRDEAHVRTAVDLLKGSWTVKAIEAPMEADAQ